MTKMTAAGIVEYAKKVGFDRCGLVPVGEMEGYEEKLRIRMDRFPATREKYSDFLPFAHLKEDYPWAETVVICSFWYGKYRIPDNLKGRIAKYYLTDGRRDRASEGYKASVAFEEYLKESGLKVATNRHFGITALRWAAMKAGIGIIRKNNFLYTEKGSYQYLEAFLIDEPLEYRQTPDIRPCSEKCDLCVRACPTGSLEGPYSMCRNTCVSCLTTWDGWDLTVEPLRDRFGSWVYGCDECQDACPHNRKSWTDEEEFPGLEELATHLSNEEIVKADYDWIHDVLQPKLWYIPKDKIWRYKTNALNAMLNNYSPEYLTVIRGALDDEYVEVRHMAQWVLKELGEDLPQDA